MTTWYMIFCYGLFLFCCGFIAGNLFSDRLIKIRIAESKGYLDNLSNTGTEFANGVDMAFKVMLRFLKLEINARHKK